MSHRWHSTPRFFQTICADGFAPVLRTKASPLEPLGKTYPKPVVNHGEARERALAAYKSLKND